MTRRAPLSMSPARLRQVVAQTAVWCVVDRATGDVIGIALSRSAARTLRQHTLSPTVVVVRANVVLTGVRA